MKKATMQINGNTFFLKLNSTPIKKVNFIEFRNGMIKTDQTDIWHSIKFEEYTPNQCCFGDIHFSKECNVIFEDDSVYKLSDVYIMHFKNKITFKEALLITE